MKKKDIKFIQIPIILYRLSVIIFFNQTLDKIIKTGIKRGINKEKFTVDWKEWPAREIENKNTQGFCLNYGEENKDVLIWLKKRPEKLSEYLPLYHELYHAVDFIADSRNFSVEDKISEPKAYLFEYLFKQVSEFLWNCKK